MALTEADYKAIGSEIRGTRRIVYDLAASGFGHKWESGDFDALKKAAGVFCCELCGYWLPVWQESTLDDVCENCADDAEPDLYGDEEDD